MLRSNLKLHCSSFRVSTDLGDTHSLSTCTASTQAKHTYVLAQAVSTIQHCLRPPTVIAAMACSTPRGGTEQNILPDLQIPPHASPPALVRFLVRATTIKTFLPPNENRTWVKRTYSILIFYNCCQVWLLVIACISLFHGFAMWIGRAIIAEIITAPSHNHAITRRGVLAIGVAGVFFSSTAGIFRITSSQFWKMVYDFPVKLWVGVLFLFGVVCSAVSGAIIHAVSQPEEDLNAQWMILNYCIGMVAYTPGYILWVVYIRWKSRKK
ncbi:hypothetical protein DL96DRAFT_1279168 [Flagelloscypha sp. PMI_526]|nr:hypothetical protein DL96DRAFT_1279168 [Flagelloscypha sp. PMI_526]